ncbi:hypothetical protein M0802_004891 [Mischocyttarus mexicanus]|nr:hypothetical protein M0802_004891 [Mischocyttarus mexicanus]
MVKLTQGINQREERRGQEDDEVNYSTQHSNQWEWVTYPTLLYTLDPRTLIIVCLLILPNRLKAYPCLSMTALSRYHYYYYYY